MVFRKSFGLFPLNRCGWLRGDIIHDTIDMLYLIYDTGRNLIQYLIGDSCPIGSHEVGCGYATQGNGIIIGTEVTHNANGAHICDNCEILVNISIQTRICTRMRGPEPARMVTPSAAPRGMETNWFSRLESAAWACRAVSEAREFISVVLA